MLACADLGGLEWAAKDSGDPEISQPHVLKIEMGSMMKLIQFEHEPHRIASHIYFLACDLIAPS